MFASLAGLGFWVLNPNTFRFISVCTYSTSKHCNQRVVLLLPAKQTAGALVLIRLSFSEPCHTFSWLASCIRGNESLPKFCTFLATPVLLLPAPIENHWFIHIIRTIPDTNITYVTSTCYVGEWAPRFWVGEEPPLRRGHGSGQLSHQSLQLSLHLWLRVPGSLPSSGHHSSHRESASHTIAGKIVFLSVSTVVVATVQAYQGLPAHPTLYTAP